MSNETNWLKDLPPFQPDEDPQRAERVQTRVLQKLDEPVESEEIAMKPKMTFRRIRPLIFAAAAVAVAGSSLLVGCGEDEYQKTGKIGSTLKLMGTFKTYKSTDAANAGKAPAFTLNSGSTDTGTFTCTVNIKCTTKKVPLYVTNECFELTVTHNKTEKNYAKQYITITDPEFDLKESEEAKDFKLTINNVTIKEGDKVDLKYWPRIQASSGNSGYTRAFCTWKMTAKKDATTGKITLE